MMPYIYWRADWKSNQKWQKNSWSFSEQRASNQKIEGLPEAVWTVNIFLTTDIKVRWNSTYLMLQRLSKQKRAVNLYSVEHGGINTLSSSDWNFINDITNVLKLFYEAMLDLSYDNAYISIIILLTSLSNRKLQSRDDNKNKRWQIWKNNYITALTKDAYIKDHPSLITSTLLDPSKV